MNKRRRYLAKRRRLRRRRAIEYLHSPMFTADALAVLDAMFVTNSITKTYEDEFNG